MEAELKTANTVSDMLDILKKYYDCENCRPGAIGKGVFIKNMPTALLVLGVKPKNEYK
jgi:hypothetical protein